MFNYKYPIDGNSATNAPQMCISVRVMTISLVHFFNVCDELGVVVDQVYDFYA